MPNQTLSPDLTSVRHIREMRLSIYRHMLATRGWKYKVFLRYLRFFKWAAFAPVRGAFLESYYTLMRYLDDVVDGDASLPEGYQNESEYLLAKIRFAEDPGPPGDDVEALILYCYELAGRFGANFREETSDIMGSLLFDARRRGRMIIFPREELLFHFHKLDIRGTIRATLKIFREDPDKYTILEPLGIACRFQFDLEDFEDDIASGYVNIPREDCERFGISSGHLSDPAAPPIRAWLRYRAKEGLALLEEHHRVLPQGHFSLFIRAVLRQVYELPARKVFLQVLRDTSDLA